MDLRNYSIITASYWGFTLTDGALRMLVLLHFHALGYSPVKLAFLFLLYEFCGILTNLLGGWIGSRIGLKITLYTGLTLQIIALVMLSMLNTTWATGLSVVYVMVSQAFSGIAKDLTKMSSKSAVKLLVTHNENSLFKWVSILTGSKNALKGVGFFLGGLLLTWFGFSSTLWFMATGLTIILITALIFLKQDLGKTKVKVPFSHIFSKSREINGLSAARLFLFASRDVWFVVALPVFLKESFGWSFNQVGAFMATWVIGYGIVQASAPKLTRRTGLKRSPSIWVAILTLVTFLLALLIQFDIFPVTSLIIGLSLFGVVFAINSALHSYLVLAFTNDDEVALNVGFYYMANACGRLLGTLLSGLSFLLGGLTACLWSSVLMLVLALLFSLPLPSKAPNRL